MAAASKMLANMVYQYKGMGLSMVCTPACLSHVSSPHAGHHDLRLGQEGRPSTSPHPSPPCSHVQGPGLFYVDSDGTRMADDVFSVGSGSPYAYGVLDSGYKWDLSGMLPPPLLPADVSS